MHPKVFREFEKISSSRATHGRVLEVGAVPGETSLLCMRSLNSARQKIGINLNGPDEYKDFKILNTNANDMSIFQDGYFDMTLCNGVLEHDKFFWRSISEIRRVTKSGGLIVIGVPGYVQLTGNLAAVQANILFRIFKKIRWHSFMPSLFRSTLTLEVHNAPGDYYRFTEQTFREVFFLGFNDIKVIHINFPPNIIGSAIKP
ncbi:MAG: methyltransferase domain-containing protein [Anaerolineales bacterium]|nr:methyltransferase domain-containing protein [Anaerolineales bacterium]